MTFTRTVAVITLCLTLGASALAQVGPTNDTQRWYLHEAGLLVSSAFEADLESPVASMVGGIGPGQSAYLNTRLADALSFMRGMIRIDRLALADLGGGLDVHRRHGLYIDRELVDDMASTDPATKAKAKIAVAALLANAAIHLAQKESSDPGVHCDQERDSELFTELFLNRVLAALTDANDQPHASMDDVANDPQAIGRLAGFLGPLTPAQISCLVASVTQWRDKVHDVRVNVLENGANWESYYRSDGDRNWIHREAGVAPGRGQATLTSADGVTTETYVVNFGELITQTRTYDNDLDEKMLVLSTVGPIGDQYLYFYRDLNGDGVPDPTPAVPPVGTNLFGADPGLGGTGIHGIESASARRLLLHEPINGGLDTVLIGPDGLPLGPPVSLGYFPLLGAPMAPFFGSWHQPIPGVDRFLFHVTPPSALNGGTPSFWVDSSGGAGTLGSGTDAQGRAAERKPGIASILDDPDQPILGTLSAGTVWVRLLGAPGALVTLGYWDANGNPVVVGTALMDSSGRGPADWVTFEPDRLYYVGDGLQTCSFYVPPAGRSVDATELDEGGDGTVERIELSMEPTRLNLLRGSASSLERFLHHDQALAYPTPTHLQGPFSTTTREIATPDGPRSLTLLPGDRYADGVHDLDGDGVVAEAVVIGRAPGAPGYTAEIWSQVGTNPTQDQAVPLPVADIPRHFSVEPSTGPGHDICVVNVDGSIRRLARNDSGAWQLVGALRPGSGEDFGMSTSVNDFATCGDVVAVQGGDVVTITVESPNGTFDLSPVLLVGQGFDAGTPPVGLPAFSLHVNPAGTPPPFLLVNGLAPTPFGSSGLLAPGGNSYPFVVPGVLPAGGFMMQAIVVDPLAANGFFATSDGLEVQVQ